MTIVFNVPEPNEIVILLTYKLTKISEIKMNMKMFEFDTTF